VKIIYTKHALGKFKLLEIRGWKLNKKQINNTIKIPKWSGKTKLGQIAAMSPLDSSTS